MNPIVSPTRRRIGLAAVAALSALSMAIAPAAIATDSPSYVLFSPGTDSVSMSGSTDDIRRARQLRSGNEALLYVRQGGSAYVIRDPATLRQARAIFKPQETLGVRQAELGSRQAALGAEQAKLGARQAQLGLRQANATPREATELARQQGELGRQQGELGRRQGELGQQQGALGREQARLGAIARDQFAALLADAMRRGLAKRVN